jgi:PHS family inorganic phosphate transporter-like MFS transporter
MIILVAGFKESLASATSYATCSGVCALAVDKMWRVLVGKKSLLPFAPISSHLPIHSHSSSSLQVSVQFPPASPSTTASPSPKRPATPST